MPSAPCPTCAPGLDRLHSRTPRTRRPVFIIFIPFFVYNAFPGDGLGRLHLSVGWPPLCRLLQFFSVEPVDVTPLRVSTFWPGLAPAPATTATSTAPPSTTPAAAPATTVAHTAAVTTPSNVLEMLIQCLAEAETDQLEAFCWHVGDLLFQFRSHLLDPPPRAAVGSGPSDSLDDMPATSFNSDFLRSRRPTTSNSRCVTSGLPAPSQPSTQRCDSCSF